MTTKTKAKVFKPDGPAGPEETLPLKKVMERRSEEKEHDPSVEMPPRNPVDNFRTRAKNNGKLDLK